MRCVSPPNLSSDLWRLMFFWILAKAVEIPVPSLSVKGFEITNKKLKMRQTLHKNKHHLYSHGNVTFTWNSLSNQWFKDCLSLTWEISEEARTFRLDFNELFLPSFLKLCIYLQTSLFGWAGSWPPLGRSAAAGSGRCPWLRCGGFSLRGFLCRAQASVLVPTGSVALPHVGSSQTSNPARVPCIGRRIPYPWTTREVLFNYFLN